MREAAAAYPKSIMQSVVQVDSDAMPRKRTRVLPQIVVVIVDHDAARFSVVGPVADDDGICRMVVALQRQGRRVRCFSAREGCPPEEVAAEYAAQTRYVLAETRIR